MKEKKKIKADEPFIRLESGRHTDLNPCFITASPIDDQHRKDETIGKKSAFIHLFPIGN